MRHHFIQRLIVFLVFFHVTFVPLFAQDFINEDFLDNIESNAASLWNESIPAFSVQAVPEKYGKESGVIIGYRRMVNIDKKSRAGFLSKGERSLIFIENVRFKIWVGDKNAVDNFSTIYFRYLDKTEGFSVKLLKAGGESRSISLNDAVQVDASTSIPEFFKSFFDQESGRGGQYYKVAIPDLQPGDILEYVTITKSKLNVSQTGYIEFSPQYEVCSKNYPILFNEIIIETDDKSYFKSMSFNGAPEFRMETSSEPGFSRYVFTDKDRPTEKDVNFVNRFKHFPLVKFQVIYSNSEKVKGALIGSKGEIKAGFSKEELARRAWEDYVLVGSQVYQGGMTVQLMSDRIWAEMKKSGAKDWPEADYIEKVYYRLRNLVVNRDSYLSDKVAAFIFSSLLNQRDIKPELIISISNQVGHLKDVLFDDEIRYAVKVKDRLFFNCTDHSNPGDLVESLLGCEAYIIGMPDKRGNQEINNIKLPSINADNSLASYDISASLLANKQTLSVKRVSTYKGISKNRVIENALRYTTYMLDDYKNYGGASPQENMSERTEDEYMRSIKALKDHFKQQKPEYVKQQLQSEFGQKVNSKGFTLQSSGRSKKTADLVYTEEFEMDNRVRKSGKRLLVNVIGLVAGQLQIKKDERERRHDISIGYPRTLQWVITFKVPDGYNLEGVSELNLLVDNEAGTYESKAEQKGQDLVLTIKKVYKQMNMPKSLWKDMLAFVDAAYNNTQKYILLVPKI